MAPPVSTAPLSAWLRLAFARRLGPVTAHTLVNAFGSPQAVLEADPRARAAVAPRIALDAFTGLQIDRRVDEALQWAASGAGRHLIALDDPGYPARLRTTPDAPLVLHAIGDPARLRGDALAIVGSRNASPGGARLAQGFAREIARHGIAIASGLARGIDGAAHAGALEAGGITVAVLGTGVDVPYPSAHRPLYERIASDGVLLSEAPLGTPARADAFPRRNRIISGLARGVLVVEAAIRSGSLITARLAADQGRDVYAVPGSIHSPLSKGCHRLIKDGALLVDDALDVLEDWGIVGAREGTHGPDEASTPTPPWLRAMAYDPFTVDDLAEQRDWTAAEASAALLEAELAGVVARLSGGRWQRL